MSGECHRCSVSRILEEINPPLWIPHSDRLWLADLWHKLDFKTGAEIGVGSGPFSEEICKRVPGVKLYAVDLWKPYKGYDDFTVEAELEADYQKAVERLKPYSNVEFMRTFSMDALRGINDGTLDFVYIDANHYYPWIDADILFWSDKVRSGGIISGHDYAANHLDVRLAVDKYVSVHNIRPLFVVGEQTETGRPDIIPSWFFVKP